MRKKIRIRLITVLLSLSLLCGGSQALLAATAMPYFNLPDATSGEMVNSDSFAGKAKLVIFFATWCPPCMEEVPILKQLQAAYGDNEFAVVALSMDRLATDVHRFVTRNDINYSVLMADRTVAQNFGGVSGVPVTFLVNKEGNVLRKYQGLVPHKLLEREVKKMLE